MALAVAWFTNVTDPSWSRTNAIAVKGSVGAGVLTWRGEGDGGIAEG